jgi:hypothetical protein
MPKSFTTTRRTVSKFVRKTAPKRAIGSRIREKSPDNVPSSTKWWSYLRIYRKTISNLKIREKILLSNTNMRQNTKQSNKKMYKVGPTLIWTEIAADLGIFTTAENYKKFMSFEAPFNNPCSSKFLKKILKHKKMHMKKGTILIKQATPKNATNIPVHFCAYRIDNKGILSIFDPSWHRADPGVYSTTAFYQSLDAFGISYVHAENDHTHYYQSVLPNDVFCQTWSLVWLMETHDITRLSIPKTREEAVAHLSQYISGFSNIVLDDIDAYMALFPTYKLEGNDPSVAFETIIQKIQLILGMM